VVAWVLAGSAAFAAADDDTRFLEGLRERRLFRLAETFCRQRLADQHLSPVGRTTWTTELIRCCAGQALHAAPEARDPWWRAARETAAEFLRQQPPPPRSELVRAQDALTLVTRGELLRQEAEVLPDPAAAWDTARGVLREAARLLEQLDNELARATPLRRRRDAGSPELTADELSSLQHNVRYQLARNFRNQALCYPAGSADRAAALAQGTDHLARSLAQLADSGPLADRMQLELAVSQRLLGNFVEANQTLEQLGARSLEPSLQPQLQAETARLRIDQGRPQDALAVLAKVPVAAGQSADLDYAFLEAAIALWKAAVTDNKQAQADRWRSEAVTRVKTIEQSHGPYWGRRAELLLINSGRGMGAAADADVLARAADDVYRQGKIDEARAAYDQAAATARDPAQAFALRYKAALIDHTQKRHAAAAVRLRRLGCDLATQPNARDAHLLAAWNAAQAAAHDAHRIEAYTEILDEHLRLWPQGPTADTARLWLGRVRESQQDWRAAVAAYAGVSREHASFADATRGAARCSQHMLAQAQSLRELTDAQVQSAAGLFAARVAPQQADPLAVWTALDRFCAETAARLLLQFAPARSREAEATLRAALTGVPSPDAQWKAEAQALLILAVAAQPGRHGEAARLLERWEGTSPDQLSGLLDGLTRLASSATGERKQELAQLQLNVVGKLWSQRAGLAPAQQRALGRVRADALTLAGQRREAVAAFAELARAQPDDADIQLAYAEALLGADDAESWRQALDQWRVVGSRSQPQSELWYRGKYSVAQALFQLGEKEEAARRIRYLQSVPPGLEKTAWKSKFLDLLRRCDPQ
jgi:hypothetical protein